MNQTMIPKNCTNCGSELDTTGKFCKECGTSIESMTALLSQSFQIELFCPNCGRHIGADDKFCRFCAIDLIKSREGINTQTTTEIQQLPPTPSIQVQNVPNRFQPINPPSEPNAQTEKEKYSHSAWSESLPSTSGLSTQQAGNAPDNPASFISPSGAAFAVICFFLPWLKISQCGVTKTISGSEAANLDGSFWVFPLMGIVSIAAYFIAKNQKQLWKARPFIYISSGFALILLFYKYNSIPSAPEIMGQRITAADLGITLGFGSYGTIIGFVLAISGCAFMSRQNNGVLPTVNSQKISHALPTVFESADGKLKPNVAAMLCYVLPPVFLFVGSYSGSVVLPLLFVISFIAFQVFLLNAEPYKKNSLIRLHNYQSMFLVAGYFLGTFLLGGFLIMISNESSFLNPSFWSNLQFIGLISVALSLVYLGLSMFMAVKSYQKQMYQLPYIGDWAIQRAKINSDESVVIIAPIPTLIAPISQPAQQTLDKPPNVTGEASSNEIDDFARIETVAETSEVVLSEMSPTENYIADFGMSREAKTVFGIVLGGTVLLFALIAFSSSDSKREKTDSNISTSNLTDRSYNTNTSYYNSTSSYDSTNSISDSARIDQMNQSEIAANSSTSTNSSFVSSSSKKGRLVTDSNIRNAPKKDAYSVGIHYKDAKVEILDETSYEVEEKVSVWYKVHITEYGCSRDSSLGCGKNSDNDADDGWVNAKNVLITDGNNSASSEQMTFQQPRKIENYSVRIYNVDDSATVYVNGSVVLKAAYSRVENSDITGALRPGNNEVRFVLENSIKEFTYGFEMYKNNKSIFKDECGVIGKFGCKGSLQTGLVYDRTITVKVNAQ